MIDDINYSAALVYIYKRASRELERFNDRGFLEKIVVKQNEVLFCKRRIVKSSELSLLGHLSKTMMLDFFTGINHL